MNDMTYDYGSPYGLQRIVGIEYVPQGRQRTLRPHSVFTADHLAPTPHLKTFDFNWSRAHNSLYFNCSGSGGGFYLNGIYEPHKKPQCAVWWDHTFLRPVSACQKSRVLSDRTIKRMGFIILQEPILLDGDPNPFNDACDGQIEYCDRCNDHFPTEYLCAHIFWCEECGTYSTPSERCGHRRDRV